MDLRARALSPRDRQGAGAIAAVETGQSVGPAVPFRGVHPFRLADHEIFFAREEEADELRDLVAIYRGVALYGPSGTGKSSLINAGLLPRAIRGGLVPERLRVQAEPRGELVVERIQASDGPHDLLPSKLSSGTDASSRKVLSVGEFEECVEAAARSDRLLLVFDQFEELLTLFDRPGAVERQEEVVAMLVRLLRGTLPVKLLFSFREDYLAQIKDRLFDFPELVDQALHLTAPSAAALRAIIRGPFEQPQLHFARELSPALTATLVSALAERFGAGEVSLTEVQIVCDRLWWTSDPEALLAVKGVRGILEDSLGEALDAFPTDLKGAAVALLGHMVTSSGTRNVISEEDLVSRVTAEEKILPALLETALDRLERESALVRRERRRNQDLYEVTSEFLLPWIAGRREEFRRAQERRRDRRRLIIVGGIAIALLMLAGVVTALALSANRAREEARTQAAAATSVALASSATQNLGSRPDVSLLLALAANQVSASAEARVSMIAALQAAQRSGAVGILHGHAGGVGNVAFNPNGRVLASAGFDRTIRLWDVATHRQIGAPLMGNEGFVNGVVYSPDGHTLASAGEDGTIRFWDRSGQSTPPIDARAGRVYDVAFSPDGRTIASASEDGTVRLWDVRSRRQRAVLRGHRDGVYAVDYSGDGRYLASSGDDRTARLWNARSGRLVATLAGQGTLVRNVVFSPNGRTLATASDSQPGPDCSTQGVGCGTIWLWNVRTQRRIGKPLTGQRGNVRGMAFSPDGRTLASASYDGTVQLWDVRTQKGLGAPLTGPTVFISNVAFSPDGRTLAAASFDRTIRLWDVRDRRDLGAPLTVHAATVNSIAFSPSGRTLASAGDDGRIQLADVRSYQALSTPLTGHAGRVTGVAFSPDGRRLASVGADDTLRFWDPSIHRAVGSPLTADASGLTSVAFSPDGRTVATGGNNGTVRLWNVASRRAIEPPLTGHASRVTSIAFSRDGSRLAAAGDDQTIRLWDPRARRPVGVITGDTDSVNSIAFSPDGRTLASGSSDLTIRLWDVRTQRQLGPAVNGTVRVDVRSVAFSPDGRTLASGSSDKTVRLWDLPTRRLIGAPLLGHPDIVNSVAFSPDGVTLASGGARTARLWEGLFWRDRASLQRRVCALMGTGLHRAEWEEFMPGVRYRPTCP